MADEEVDLTDETLAEVHNISDTESIIYVPYTEFPDVAVWVTDKHLQMFTNVSEETAATLADGYPEHFYFFAELSTS